MKANFLFAIALFMPIMVSGQITDDMYKVKDGAVVVEEVIPFTISKDMASAAVNSYFVTNLNDSNHTLKNSSNDYYVAKIISPILAYHSAGAWYTRANLTIDVRFKEDRMKVSVSCSNISQESKSGVTANYNIVNAAPISDNHDIWEVNIPKKAAIKSFEQAVIYMHVIVAEIKEAVQKAKQDDEW